MFAKTMRQRLKSHQPYPSTVCHGILATPRSPTSESFQKTFQHLRILIPAEPIRILFTGTSVQTLRYPYGYTAKHRMNSVDVKRTKSALSPSSIDGRPPLESRSMTCRRSTME